jgi:hypothetical protein
MYVGSRTLQMLTVDVKWKFLPMLNSSVMSGKFVAPLNYAAVYYFWLSWWWLK